MDKIITFNAEEFRILQFAIHSFEHLVKETPIIMGQGVTRSDAMRARRAATRLKSKIDQYAQHSPHATE